MNNLLNQKPTLSKRSSYEKRCFKLEGHLRHATLPRVDHSKKKENKWIRKIDCYIMHLKNLIESKWKSRKQKCWENDEKLHKHKSFFSCKDLLFNLGNRVWNEKWPSFIIPSLIKKFINSLPFEPDNFLLYLNQGSTSTPGGKGEEKSPLKL